MATSQEGDLTTCLLCLESYRDPCTLQCKHSFCRRCITDYVKTQAHAEQNKTIPCPSCRQVTRVPDPSRPVDEWAVQLTADPVIEEEGEIVDYESIQDVPCSTCEEQGETTPSEFWCAQCELVFCHGCAEAHLVRPASHDHNLYQG